MSAHARPRSLQSGEASRPIPNHSVLEAVWWGLGRGLGGEGDHMPPEFPWLPDLLRKREKSGFRNQGILTGVYFDKKIRFVSHF